MLWSCSRLLMLSEGIEVNQLNSLKFTWYWKNILAAIPKFESSGPISGRKSVRESDALLKSALFKKNYFFLIWIKSVKNNFWLGGIRPLGLSKRPFVKYSYPFLKRKVLFQEQFHSFFIIFDWNRIKMNIIG